MGHCAALLSLGVDLPRARVAGSLWRRTALLPRAHVDSLDEAVDALVLPLREEVSPFAPVVRADRRVAVMRKGKSLTQNPVPGHSLLAWCAASLWPFYLNDVVRHHLPAIFKSRLRHLLTGQIVSLALISDLRAGNGKLTRLRTSSRRACRQVGDIIFITVRVAGIRYRINSCTFVRQLLLRVHVQDGSLHDQFVGR